MATSLLPFWATSAPHEKRRGFFGQALRVAEGLEDSDLAASLLQPFPVEALTPGRAAAFVALVRRYGEDWTQSLLSDWASSRERRHEYDQQSWPKSLPSLCKALEAVDKSLGNRAAELLLRDRWKSLRQIIEETVRFGPPSRRDQLVLTLAKPILGIFKITEIVGADTLRNEALAFFGSDRNDPLLSCLLQMLRRASEKRDSTGFDAIRQHCIQRLRAHLELPARDEDDWSIALPGNCRCELCTTLGAFLSDPAKQQLEWPLATPGRRHIHSRLDQHELPVRHTTRRKGRPYTLVLSKTMNLFEQEREKRCSWQSDLDWLTKPQR